MAEATAEKLNPGFEPDLVVFYCQQAVKKDVDLAGASRKLEGFTVRFVNLPCSSNLEISGLVKIFERGVDGVQVVGCPVGTCRFLGGNTRADRKVKYVKQLLGQMNFGAERIGMVRAGSLGEDDLKELAKMRAEAVSEIGPNPMKS